ncbi:uncharacterized protein KY384_000568 [Bacidia gigantensis]|uniref:uncharacterized protein n=1 Tax=Bacidia gigantensis TaxID=2732470 RepID=UPI001D04376D|nr:uncharacterized protein KY384_000568 [Bacidia gigantensis]KAG8525808.1 hypothetical protein KY384_000568 [Bacidia gigantensis]
MVFHPPSWVPPLPFDPPDSIPISEFMLNEQYGRHPFRLSRPPFTCGLTGLEYSWSDVCNRVNALASGLSKELGFTPNEGTEWDKVVCVFSVNTIDTVVFTWALHYLGGISSPANAAYSEDELVYQLKSSSSKALFTCVPLLETSIAAARKCGIPKDRVYLFDVPKQLTGASSDSQGFKTVNQLIEESSSLPQVERLRWTKGEGARRTAFLCYSSGTSGLPKGVKIAHRNLIANVLQVATSENPHRAKKKKPGDEYNPTEVSLGILPQSHIYSLVLLCHTVPYRGDQVINIPKFDLPQVLAAIQRFKINNLYLVPPIIIAMKNNPEVLKKFDLTSVETVFTGAAPVGPETAEQMQKQHPKWLVRQGYGLTETSTVVCSTAFHDVMDGSCGSLLPGFEAKLVSIEGNEIKGYDQPGELVVRSPSVTLGYLNNDKANQETFVDGWVRTGDEAVVRKSPKGYEHIFIVDRIKELIKVKGLQVAPAELEAHLLTHPAVADCTVIPIADDTAGERPKAFVVKSSSVGLEDNDRILVREIKKHVEKTKARHKWLAEVVFVDTIPKSPSGKILRRLLRDKDREERRKQGPRL